MADFNMNSNVDRAQVYDCFVQLKSGSDRYRLKSLQKVDPQFRWPNLERISDDGQLFLNQQVIGHRVEMELRLTSDEVDTANPPTNTRTISYYIYQKDLRNSVLVSLSIVYYSKDTATNKFLRLDLQFELEETGIPRITGDGDTALTIAGRVLLVNPAGADISPTFIRQAS